MQYDKISKQNVNNVSNSKEMLYFERKHCSAFVKTSHYFLAQNAK